MQTVAIVNKSSLVDDTNLIDVCMAIQQQVTFHLMPAWNVSAVIAPIRDGMATPADAWVIELHDTCDLAGALGYHMDEHTPWGVVGIKTAIDDGVPWSSVVSHEVLEMLCDPWATVCMQSGNKLYALEVCDPVEGQPYLINSVHVENFILPAWYRLGGPGPYDYCNRLPSPLALLRGGYDSTMDASSWTQLNADSVRASKQTATPLSRRGRRFSR